MTIKIGDKIEFNTSRVDASGIEVFGRPKRGIVQKVLQEGGEAPAYAVRYKGKVHIVLDTQVKP